MSLEIFPLEASILKSLSEAQSERQEAPRTTMVYCPPCMRHWEAPANEKWWQARTELCPEHQAEKDA